MIKSHVLYTLVLCSAALAGCADLTDPSEPAEVGIAESAVEIDTFYLPLSRQCEGYTGGGGQRVRGRVWAEQLAWTASTMTWRVTVEAQNWKKNFGWNTKRTSELSIEGTVTLTDGFVSQTWDASMDTGGSLETAIGHGVDFAPVHRTTTPGWIKITANLTFRGRDGTVCSL